MAYASPKYSRGRVDRAGRSIAEQAFDQEDVDVLENWRASHAHILNTFKQLLYNRAPRHDVIVAQRLKRRPTIVDKLTRFPDMNLSRMHDIAGCRLIFPSIEELQAFRSELNSGRFDHKRRNEGDGRWNYLDHPKEDGYRGIHDAFKYEVEPKDRRMKTAQPWNGMLIEIQYRTFVQHAWSTAVEVAGLVTVNNPKFGRGRQEVKDFFRVSSEILARSQEGMHSSLREKTSKELLFEVDRLEDETHIQRLFANLNANIGEFDFKKISILIFRYAVSEDQESSLEVRTFQSVPAALAEYSKLERELAGAADIVLVGTNSAENMKSAFRNYFADTSDFLELLEDSRKHLQKSK
jgi:putative GTP pyrophosphokinase